MRVRTPRRSKLRKRFLQPALCIRASRHHGPLGDRLWARSDRPSSASERSPSACASTQFESAKSQIAPRRSMPYRQCDRPRSCSSELERAHDANPIVYVRDAERSQGLDHAGRDGPYEVHVVDIEHGDQHRPEFLALNPNNKIPVIVAMRCQRLA